MINLNNRTKNKMLNILREEYKKSFGKSNEDLFNEKDFNEIHNLGTDELSMTKIHLTQVIMELFGVNVGAYNYAVKHIIEETERFEREMEADDCEAED